MRGFKGKILFVDLEREKSSEQELGEATYRSFLSGSGLALKLLMEQEKEGQEEPVIVASGLMSGTLVPSSNRLSICARSPLTGAWCESSVGGAFSSELKYCGYDALVLTGRAKRPLFLSLQDQHLSFHEAQGLWGKDTFESTRLIQGEVGPEAQVACIGPAGERQSLLACIILDGRLSRAAGRGGLGALWGGKNLKAISLKGTTGVRVFDPQRLHRIIKELLPTLLSRARGLSELGTAMGVLATHFFQDLPIKHFQLRSWPEGVEAISGERIREKFSPKSYACGACPIGCGKVLGMQEGFLGHGPEYETLAGFGSNCLNPDLESIILANQLCNRYGLDTISTSLAISFAMEAREEGFIHDEEVPFFGDSQGLLSLLEKIAKREGLGAVLADGIKRASEQLGLQGHPMVLELKGLEFPLHDPRAFMSMALHYTTALRGPCHLEGLTYYVESGASDPGLGFPEAPYVPKSPRDAALLVYKMQNFLSLFNALGICKFLLRGGLRLEHLRDLTEAVTGWPIQEVELMALGERLFNLKRLYNLSHGQPPAFQGLPERLMGPWGREGLEAMLKEYCQLRGWDEEGKPTEERMEQLGLRGIV